MAGSPLRFAWTWRLESSPERFWPLLADTDRFNREAGIPPLLPLPPGDTEVPQGARLLSVRKFGYALRWIEKSFEWLEPRRFEVERLFLNGPLRSMRVEARLEPEPGGGTRLEYGVALVPRFAWSAPLLGTAFRFVLPRKFGPVIAAFDKAAREGQAPVPLRSRMTFASGGLERLAARGRELLESGADPVLVERLRGLVLAGEDSDLDRLRPYALADGWKVSRRPVLETCLLAARAGILDFSWDLLCPSCRGAKATASGLRDLPSAAHCDSCGIDFKAAFDRNVEVTFRPNRAIRRSEAAQYCLAGPRKTPHIAAQVSLPPGAAAVLDLSLEEGRFRLRTPGLPGALYLRAETGGEGSPLAAPGPGGWPRGEAVWSPSARLTLRNDTGLEALFALERTAWADDAVTAAEITALQAFRDLFAEEALRPGEEISVGRLAFLFTDLRGSTRLYREVGDAKAFGLVMEHFDLLKAAIAGEGGAVVKTIGDAVLAVFPEPLSAVRAALEAHRRLEESSRGLVLKAGIHCGPCIAVNQNGRLDYFGSTLNLAARLLGFCEGGDLVLTREAANDPATAGWLSSQGGRLRAEEVEAQVRGFDNERFSLRRLVPERSRLPLLTDAKRGP
jgi:class 3 adenylate cyclase